MAGRAEDLRVEAGASSLEDCSNRAWYLREVAVVRGLMVKSMQEMRNGNYYEAWCNFERMEIAIDGLRSNAFFEGGGFEIAKLSKQVEFWQGIFPYKVFMSPEFVIKKASCSICKAIVDPWEKCGHKAGKVYSGEMCCRVIEEAIFLSISMVLDPVQKYSVAFVRDESGNYQFNYSMVEFVVDRISNPFDQWSYKLKKAYHPHDFFSEIDRTDSCPCGSGRQYLSCCLRRPGVIRPHYQIAFEVAPPADVPTAMFLGYK